MVQRFSYVTTVSEHCHLELVIEDEKDTPLLKVAGESYKQHFRGPEIAALHAALHRVETAAGTLAGVAAGTLGWGGVENGESEVGPHYEGVPIKLCGEPLGEGVEPIRPSELGMLREMADGAKALLVTPYEVDFIRLRRMAAEAQEKSVEELSDADLGERPRSAGE